MIKETVRQCTFMDALEPRIPAPVVGARQIINMHDDARRYPISPEEEKRLMSMEQKLYRNRRVALVAQ